MNLSVVIEVGVEVISNDRNRTADAGTFGCGLQ